MVNGGGPRPFSFLGEYSLLLKLITTVCALYPVLFTSYFDIIKINNRPIYFGGVGEHFQQSQLLCTWS